MVNIITRGESRKLKDRNRKAAKRSENLFRNSENEKLKKRVTNLRQNKEYVQASNLMRNNRRRHKIIKRTEYNNHTNDSDIPLHVLKLDNEFEKMLIQNTAWPQQVNSEIKKDALAKFRSKVDLNELRELPCAICSGFNDYKNYKRISVKDIEFSILEAPINLTDPSFEIDFDYQHPYINATKINLLLDRSGFIYNNPENRNNPFDLRICNECFTYLQKHKIPPLSLANNMWIGSTPTCLQDLTIPEQLLISPGYLSMNLIQLTKRKHTHHKLKGHVITLPQNPGSLIKILPLPIYKLCEYLKVVFIGEGAPTNHQLKKILQVRKSKVTAALQWLFTHNKLFKNNFTFDKNALNLLPEGEIPDPLALTTTVVNMDSKETEHYTGYAHEFSLNDQELDSESEEEENSHDNNYDSINFINNNSIGSASELRPSGILHVDDVPISKKELTLLSFQKLVDSINHQSGNQQSNKSDNMHPQLIYVPHGRKPFNEYEDTTLFPAAFPVLYPYGVGGHEGQLSHITLKKYANHLMKLRDPKFRQHRSFPFVIFDILQRREVSTESYNLTRNINFEQSAGLISRLSLDDIKIAIEQVNKKLPLTNPSIVELLKNINIAGSNLMASHQSRARMRNEIRAVIIRDGSPSLFITINPADLHSPIVMMYAGNEITLENLLPENFPKATERARLAYLDPSAVAKYFDIIVKCILDTIIGYGNKKGGVFGTIKNYYGVVEYQDRGTPHCHLLVWLYGSPNPIELRQRLKNDESFCQRLLAYVSDIVKEDISYLLKENDILTDEMLEKEHKTPKTIEEKRMHPSFFPIPDPNLPDYDEKFRLDLLAITKRTLYHHCTQTCKKYNRGLQKKCRFDFPRELVNPPGMVLPKQGIIAIQRSNAFINNHNPYITVSCRGNNDIKFIASRKLALAYIYYITDYITKSDISTHSSFLLCASTLESFLTQPSNKNSYDLIDKSRKLITKCLNKISGQAELTSPQVSAYLLGISDHYTPNKFVTIYLQSFEAYLTKEWRKYAEDIDNFSDDLTTDSDQEDQETADESFLISSFNGKLTTANLRIDYQYRGISLRNICLYDYAATIRKIPINSHELSMLSGQCLREGNYRFFFHGNNFTNNHVHESDNVYPQNKSHLQRLRNKGTERIVMLSGKGIPNKDDIENAERYSLCILMLFKPWTTVLDLRDNYNTWNDACRSFLNNSSLSLRLKNIISNIELLNRCSEESTLDRELRKNALKDPIFAKACRIDRSVPGYDADDEPDFLDDDQLNDSFDNGSFEFDPLKIVRSGLKDIKMVDNTINILRLRGRFRTSNSTSLMDFFTAHDHELKNIRQSDVYNNELLKNWQTTITSRKMPWKDKVNDLEDIIPPNIYTNYSHNNNLSLDIHTNQIDDSLEKFASGLNDEQKKAYFLVCDHRQRNNPLNKNKLSQLLLYLAGAGGTGKSKVIEAICSYFKYNSLYDTLLVLAPTGIAAANIDGCTLHSVCGFGFGEFHKNKHNLSDEMLQQLQEFWYKIEYLIVDEISMVGQKLLTKFHTFLKKVKATDDPRPFAGINILFVGDFMQLPPVLDPALYMPDNLSNISSQLNTPSTTNNQHSLKRPKHKSSVNNQSIGNITGRNLWLTINHVIILKKPMRQLDDPLYANILENMRKGNLTETQKSALRSRILSDNRINSREWKDATFLVTRNDLRIQLNFNATIEHALYNNQPLVYSCAQDSYNRTILTGCNRLKFLSTPDTKENSLCGILPLSINMKVSITINICANDCLANGSQGILRQIIYDKDFIDPSSTNPKTIVLKTSPKYVIVELIGKAPGSYQDLPPNHVPIYPVKRSCVRTIWKCDGSKTQMRFQRFQLPLTPAFAFTDYKCQGQTLQKVIIDLKNCSMNNGIYVMLSRAQRLDDLLFLQPFNESILNMHLSPALYTEFNRIEECATKTARLKEWP